MEIHITSIILCIKKKSTLCAICFVEQSSLKLNRLGLKIFLQVHIYIELPLKTGNRKSCVQYIFVNVIEIFILRKCQKKKQIL